MKRQSILLLIIVILGLPSLADAYLPDFLSVQVCNKGNTALYVASAEETGGSLITHIIYTVSGWYRIDVGECKVIGDYQPETRFLGFAIHNSAGEFGMIHETLKGFTPDEKNIDRIFCVDPVNGFSREGTMAELQQCPEGFVPAHFSTEVFVDNMNLTLTIQPNASSSVELLSTAHYKAQQKAEQEAWEKQQQQIAEKKLKQKAALEKLIARAKHKDVNAQWKLGTKYYYGRDGAPQDYKEALKWFLIVASQGYAQAQVAVGYMYVKGQGTPKNYKEAVAWYRKAAERGDSAGQYNLGIMYDKGHGVPQDFKEALKWYHLSAKQGYAEAQKIIADPMHDIDARRWMTECEKEFFPVRGLTKWEHSIWCQCRVKAMLPIKAQISKATKDAIAKSFYQNLDKVWDKIKDDAYRCYKAKQKE